MRLPSRSAVALASAAAIAATALAVAGPGTAVDTPTPSPTSTQTPASPSAPAVTGTVPGAPTIVKVKGGLVSGQLLVTYRAPLSDGGSPIARYDISFDKGVNWWPCVGTDGTCTLTNLANGSEYSVQLRAVNAIGAGLTSTAQTGRPSIPIGQDPDKPARLPKPHVWVRASFDAASNGLGVNGALVRLGVGALPKLTFTQPIQDKRVVETHLAVRSIDKDGRIRKVNGAWGWISDRSAVFRPEKYWPGHSTITITSTLDRALMGKAGKAYLIGSKELATTYTFRTARKFVAKVDGTKVRMNVFIDGEKVKTIPISLGKSEWETRNGVKVISTQKEPTKTYTSQSLGLGPEEEYSLDANWNTRLTPTGEFIHTASWAYSRIGRYNGSHGCTNMFEQDARWIFETTIPGDVVEYANTGGSTVQSWNGPGGLWNIPWEDWLKKSALGSGGAVDTTDTTQGSGGTQASA